MSTLEDVTPTATGTTVHTLADASAPLTLAEFASLDAPFAAETAELFASVRDHDLPTLAARCDDDLGIIDIDPNGGAEVIRDRAGWESWFVQLFAQLDAMGATAGSRHAGTPDSCTPSCPRASGRRPEVYRLSFRRSHLLGHRSSLAARRHGAGKKRGVRTA